MGIGAIGVRRENGPPDRFLTLLTLDRAVEALEDFGGVFAFAPGVVVEHDTGWGGAAPAAIVAQHGPEVAGLRPPAPWVQHRGGGLVDIEAGAARLEDLRHVLDHGCDEGTGPAHPVGQH